MQAKLIYCDPPRPLASATLGDEPLRIGRAPSCQLRVSDFSVADEHCAVRREGDIWIVETLGADTYVNDQELPITRHPLAHRDVIRCGSLWIQCIVMGAELSPQLAQTPELTELNQGAQAVLATAAAELMQQKAQTQFLQQEKEALLKELAALKAAPGEAGRADGLAAEQQQELSAHKEAASALRKTVEQLESELAAQKRELALLQSELAQATSKTSAHSQLAQEHEAATAHLLNENKALVAEMEHLRAILQDKDQVIAEAREAPQALMAELVAVRRQCEEELAQRKRVETERDAAQIDLSRRALSLSQAEEELRKLRHQSELHERLLTASHDAGSELAKAVAANSALTVELTATRAKLAALQEQLGACLKAISFIVIELGVKVYALRAAVARQGGLTEPESNKAINDALDQMLIHLNEGNVQLQLLRRLTDQPEPEAAAVPQAGGMQIAS
ncbi:MAG TPA: FHA domain-containing protein [Pseudomonadota bacterium]|nr:FHA domain-containing protein [Pseudomonadota bacterium]